jgi:hypothetical protein
MTQPESEPIVDADGHVLEHPNAMLRYAPEKFRERIWHIEQKATAANGCLQRRRQIVGAWRRHGRHVGAERKRVLAGR